MINSVTFFALFQYKEVRQPVIAKFVFPLIFFLGLIGNN